MSGSASNNWRQVPRVRMNGRNAERWSTRPRLPLDWSDESAPSPRVRRASPTRVTEDLSQVYEDVSQCNILQRTEPSDRTWRRDPVRASRFRRRETEERRHYLNAPRLRHHGDSRDAKSPRRRALSPDIFTRPESLEEPARSNFVLPELLIADDLDDVTSGSSDDEDEVISRLSSAGSFARGRPSTHHARSRSAKSSLQHEVGETGGRYDERAYRHRRISSWNYPSSDKAEPNTGQGRGRRNAVERKERLARILNSYASDSESDSEDFGHVMSLLRPSKSHHDPRATSSATMTQIGLLTVVVGTGAIVGPLPPCRTFWLLLQSLEIAEKSTELVNIRRRIFSDSRTFQLRYFMSTICPMDKIQ